MVKKILRSGILKTLAFSVIILCVFTGVYLTTDRIYAFTEQFPEGPVYQFEGSFKNSPFLRSQLWDTLETVDRLIYDDWDWLCEADRTKIEESLLKNAVGDQFIGSISFSHNGIVYDGGADKSYYYVKATPYGTESSEPSYPATYISGMRKDYTDYDEYDTDYYEENVAGYEGGEPRKKSAEKYSNTDYILVSISQEQSEPYERTWNQSCTMVMNAMTDLLVLALIALAALIYLLCVAGKVPGDDDINMLLIDRMPIEFNLLLIITSLAGITVMVIVSAEMAFEQVTRQVTRGFMMPLSVGCAICAGFIVLLLMSIVRNVQNYAFVSRSLILRAVRWCWKKLKGFIKWLLKWKWAEKLSGCFRSIFSGAGGWLKKGCNKAGDLKRTAVKNLFSNYKVRNVLAVFFVYTLVLALLAAMFGIMFAESVGIIPFMLGAAWFMLSCSFILKRIGGFEQVVDGIKRLRAGELDYKLSGLPEGVFSSMAEDINSLGDGMKSALSTEIRAERMKSELITNVSHDLKTPLTSILNYAELLCQEQLSPEEANDYAKIIYQKSIRLKNLTSDLFDISKVQSGAEQMECERLDACTLLRQALAEQEKAVQESGLTVKASIPDKEVPIWADGKKMSRVMENLIGNCVKYALKGTRVYIKVAALNNSAALIELKNIANYEMDFDAQEITERFVRGDESRSTEGSGLGLAIAKSYVTACGGDMEVEVDGDLFKIVIKFPLFGSSKEPVIRNS